VVFEGEEIHLDPALQAQLSNSYSNHNPTLEKGGEGGFSDKNNSTIFPEHNFEDLRRELGSRKYSYKTVNPVREYSLNEYICHKIGLPALFFSNGVKGYLYYNRDFLKFTGKNPSEIIDEDIKDYLFHLAEEKKEKIVTPFYMRQPLMS
jgi:hypothetical protein